MSEIKSSIRFPLVIFPLVLSFALSAWAAAGYYASDDMTYLRTIVRFFSGESLDVSLGALRYPLIFPAALVHLLTASPFLSICFGIIYHPLLVLISYQISLRLAGVAVALLSSLLVAVCPLVYLYSGTLLPDVPQAFWSSLWLILLFHALRAENMRTAYLLVFLAALANGVAYWTKESGLLLALPGFLFSFFGRSASLRERLKFAAVYALGLLSMFLTELLLIRIMTETWAWRLGVISRPENVEGILNKIQIQGLMPSERFSHWYQSLSLVLGEVTILVLGISLLVYPFLKGRSLLVWLTTIWLFSYLTFGSTSFTRYLPPSIQDRYYVFLVLPVAVMVSHTFWVIALYLWSLLSKQKNDFVPFSLLLFISLLFGVDRFFALEDDIGFVYRSRQVKSFLTGLEVAKKEFAKFPLVLSPYLRKRMRPLLEINEGFPIKHPTGLKRDEPFVALRSVAYSKDDNFLENLLETAKIQPEKIINCSLEIFAPKNRFEELREGLLGFFQLTVGSKDGHQRLKTRIVLHVIYPIARQAKLLYSPRWSCQRGLQGASI